MRPSSSGRIPIFFSPLLRVRSPHPISGSSSPPMWAHRAPHTGYIRHFFGGCCPLCLCWLQCLHVRSRAGGGTAFGAVFRASSAQLSHRNGCGCGPVWSQPLRAPGAIFLATLVVAPTGCPQRGGPFSACILCFLGVISGAFHRSCWLSSVLQWFRAYPPSHRRQW